MKHFLILTLAALCLSTAQAQTIRSAVTVDDTGVVVAPVNFWVINGYYIRDALSEGTGILDLSLYTLTIPTLPVAQGGTGSTSASAARTALGLEIGTDVLAPDGDGSGLTGLLWSQIGETPTTLSGYGITDAQPAIDFVSAPPATPTSTGTAGQWILSGNYLYICIATDTWRRIELLTW